MDDFNNEYKLSLYESLATLNNTEKSDVYLVQNQLNNKIYVKKVLKNFNLEVYNLIKEIKSKNIPRIYEVLKDKDKLIIIEEFINGDTLQEILDREGQLEEDIVINYVINLCKILNVLHTQVPQIIHRDIKPSNIIIDNNDILKLIDFDVSRVYKDLNNVDTHILGTKGYASPEQFGFEQTDCRSDIYSIGVLMNVLTTGKHHKILENRGKLQHIIGKCISISPDDRYKTVKELQHSLKMVLGIDDSYNEDISIEANKIRNNRNDSFNNNEANYENNSVVEKDSDNINRGISKKQPKLKKQNKILKAICTLPGFRRRKIIPIFFAVQWYGMIATGYVAGLSGGL